MESYCELLVSNMSVLKRNTYCVLQTFDVYEDRDYEASMVVVNKTRNGREKLQYVRLFVYFICFFASTRQHFLKNIHSVAINHVLVFLFCYLHA